MTLFAAPAELAEHQTDRLHERIWTDPDAALNHALDPDDDNHTRCGEQVGAWKHLHANVRVCEACIRTQVPAAEVAAA